MPATQHEDLGESLERPFPAPRRFSRLKIFRRETLPSTGIALLVSFTILALLIWISAELASGRTAVPTVSVESVSLTSEEQEELGLDEPAERPEVQESSSTATLSTKRNEGETVETPTGELVPTEPQPRPRATAKSDQQAVADLKQELANLSQSRSRAKAAKAAKAANAAKAAAAVPSTLTTDPLELTGPPTSNKVTKGSFTVWTVPADPTPGQDYWIIIQMRLPKSITSLPLSDVSGTVHGTDQWFQRLPCHPGKSITYSAKAGQLVPMQTGSSLPVEGNSTRLIVSVQGASRLVRDTIAVQSGILKESQTITITF